MHYFITALVVIIILLIILILLSYFSFVSLFKRKKNDAAQRKKIASKIKKNGTENPEEFIQKADDFFKEIRYKKTTIYAVDESTLYGRLYTPEKGDAQKTVLLVHSADASASTDFYSLFDFYRSGNFNILLIHQRAHGKSEGAYKTLGIAEGYDVLSWCQWLEMRFSTGSPIIIHGKGQGTFAAVFASSMSELPANVSAVIAENIYNSVDDAVQKIFKNKFDFLSKIILPFVRIFYKNSVGFDMRSVRISAEAKRIKIPTLFINKNNEYLSSETLEKIIKRIKADAKEISPKNIKEEAKAIKEFIRL